MTRQRPPICGVFTFMEKEIWKAIPGYEGIYEVSDLGRVKSLSRERIRGCQITISKECILNPSVDSRGYYKTALRFNNKAKTYRVHQLVAMAFLNHILDGTHKIVVDHIDNNKLNNRLDNLQLITARENTSKDRKGGTSVFLGVSWSKQYNKWQSYINNNNKSINLGGFINEQEASNAYQEALTRINNGLSAKVDK